MRVCARERCGRPIPDTVRRDARFCSRACQKRAHDEAIVGECVECGVGLGRWHYRQCSGERCRECHDAGRRRRRDARAEIIADLWADGLPYRYKLSAPKTPAREAA
jgi:predicted nucleic acid-binding Zn ribbon protein